MDRMITIPEDTVCIPLEMYEDLLQDTDTKDMLFSALYEHCSLSWDKKSLSFDHGDLNMALSMLDRYRYKNTINELIKKEEHDATGTDIV